MLETVGIISLFIVMLAAPCIVAARSSRGLKAESGNAPYGENYDDPEEFEVEVPAAVPALTAAVVPNLPPDRPLTLSELATRAENDARIAQELAHEAHYAALSAAAYAARLRADAAIEAAQLAEKAIRETPLKFSDLSSKAGSRAA